MPRPNYTTPQQFYRTNDPYERVPLSQLAKINQEDPWFGLGYALAQGWNNQYNQRGVDKSVEELQKSLGPTEQERDNAKSAVLNAQPTMADDYNQLNQYLDETLKSGNAYVANPESFTSMPAAPEGSLFAAAQNWAGTDNTPMYSYGAGDARAYETGNAQAIDALTNAQAADRLRNFDINDWQAQQRANLVAQGRSPQQIEAAMAIMMPQAQALDERNKELDTQDALAQLGQLDLSGGYNPQAYQLVSRLATSNPELATLLAKDIISPRDEYEVNAQLAAQDNSFNNSVKLAQARDQISRNRQVWENNYTVEQLKRMGWNDRDIATYMAGGSRGGTGRSGNNSSLIGSKNFEFAQQRLGELRDKMDLNGGTLSPDEQNEFNQLSGYVNWAVNQTYGGFGNNAGNNTVSAGTNDFIARVDAAIANGTTNDEILAQLKQSGYAENDPVYQQIAQYLNSRSTPAANQNAAPAPQQQNEPAPAPETPPQPIAPLDANGLPHWWNLAAGGNFGSIAEANRGADGLPWFWGTTNG